MDIDRRTVVIGVIVLVALLSAGTLVLYTPTAATGTTPTTPTELNGSYSVSERVLVDGERFLERESIVDDETGEQRLVLAFEDISYDHYWTGDGEQYTKITAKSDDRLAEVLAESSNEVVLKADDEPSAIVAASGDDLADDSPAHYTFPDRLIHSQLKAPGYERTNTRTVDGREVSVYEPQTGWTKLTRDEAEDDTFYVADADGELHAGPDGQVRHANVTLERIDAATWGEYLLERGDPLTATVEYDVTESANQVAPAWMEDVR
ncbi:hypothetical protein [Natrinema versiforme]|uniref:Uncharacterized protein n=1 Tax=Natrinema versiforme TaxID=88724 RepID=A0A4V1FZ61_9EURY|nr:hypothetical protein [Natrinema versiforme]QCS41562.1 hypothetical protein FEJ81_04035 [Natrinema versiforme]